MSLWIGRIAPDTRSRDLEEVFGKYGRITRCDVKRGFAFVEFEDDRDGDDALKDLDGTEILGHRVVVEWAKGRRRERDKCFRCGREGHWARDCHNAFSRRSSSRSRSPRRRYSRSPKRHYRSRSPKRSFRSHNPPRSRSKSRSKSPKRHHKYESRDHSRSRSGSPHKSPSPKRGRTPSRSPSPKSSNNRASDNNKNEGNGTLENTNN